MKRICLLALLTIISNSAFARWEYSTGNETSSSYVNPSTIRKAAKKVKMWVLNDYVTPISLLENSSHLSIKSQDEYDCKDEMHRTLASYFFTGHMGTGEMIYSLVEPADWAPVIPDSVGEHNWAIACGKRNLPFIYSGAVEDWVKIEQKYRGFVLYGNRTALRKTGNTLTMWTLSDYTDESKIDGKVVLSLQSLVEYDCNNEKSRLLASTHHSEQMGKGDIIYSHSNIGMWMSVQPDFVGEKDWKFVCGKK